MIRYIYCIYQGDSLCDASECTARLLLRNFRIGRRLQYDRVLIDCTTVKAGNTDAVCVCTQKKIAQLFKRDRALCP